MCADNKEDEMLRTLFLLLVSLFSMPWCVANASQRDVMADSARSALSAGNSSAGTVSPSSGILHISDESAVADNSKLRYDYFFLQAISERQKGNSSAAFDLLRHCIEINPGAAEAYFYLAQYYMAMREKEKSMSMTKRAVELSPDNISFLETLANL